MKKWEKGSSQRVNGKGRLLVSPELQTPGRKRLSYWRKGDSNASRHVGLTHQLSSNFLGKKKQLHVV